MCTAVLCTLNLGKIRIQSVSYGAENLHDHDTNDSVSGFVANAACRTQGRLWFQRLRLFYTMISIVVPIITFLLPLLLLVLLL